MRSRNTAGTGPSLAAVATKTGRTAGRDSGCGTSCPAPRVAPPPRRLPRPGGRSRPAQTRNCGRRRAATPPRSARADLTGCRAAPTRRSAPRRAPYAHARPSAAATSPASVVLPTPGSPAELIDGRSGPRVRETPRCPCRHRPGRRAAQATRRWLARRGRTTR